MRFVEEPKSRGYSLGGEGEKQSEEDGKDEGKKKGVNHLLEREGGGRKKLDDSEEGGGEKKTNKGGQEGREGRRRGLLLTEKLIGKIGISGEEEKGQERDEKEERLSR